MVLLKPLMLVRVMIEEFVEPSDMTREVGFANI